ncbi:DUF3397 family protein [Paenibacillus eucommiae]|uniref:Type II secretory pathway component PulF n=1 Tax=Paenibacillus eucommiae TaxID=1355755 RepID=A0ABS4IYY8_9BACL|nr:DUF3397 family protein [Paenibacillus eucommiae]MBP1992809.1 type II secretory pathway component PulF [Paenibacillus eucommiae]
MQVVFNIFTTIYAWLAVFPLATFVIAWFVLYFFLKDKKLSTRLSMDITMLFLIGHVSALWNQLFAAKFGFWLILLLLLIAFGLIGGYQNRTKGQTNLLKVFRAVWRMGFIALTGLYVILLLLRLLKSIIFST